MLKMLATRLQDSTLRPNLIVAIGLVYQFPFNGDVDWLVLITPSLLGLVLHIETQSFQCYTLF